MGRAVNFTFVYFHTYLVLTRYVQDYNNGVTPRARRQNARQHPEKCEATPRKMRGNTPKNARRHPK